MEKQGVIRPGTTPDTEQKLPREKTADTKAAVRELDDDFSKRAAETAERALSKKR